MTEKEKSLGTECIPHVFTLSNVCHNLRQFSLYLTHCLALRHKTRHTQKTRAGCLDKNTTETIVITQDKNTFPSQETSQGHGVQYTYDY